MFRLGAAAAAILMSAAGASAAGFSELTRSWTENANAMEQIFQADATGLDYSVTRRPPADERHFTSEAVENKIVEVKRYKWLIGYFACAGIVCLLHLAGFSHTWDYSNPIVVIESFCLFFVFLYKPFHNKVVNWIASSTLAVYIIHTTNPAHAALVELDSWLLESLPYLPYLVSYLGVCVIVFVVSILYDKVRLRLTLSITDKLYNKIAGIFKPLSVYER